MAVSSDGSHLVEDYGVRYPQEAFQSGEGEGFLSLNPRVRGDLVLPVQLEGSGIASGVSSWIFPYNKAQSVTPMAGDGSSALRALSVPEVRWERSERSASAADRALSCEFFSLFVRVSRSY